MLPEGKSRLVNCEYCEHWNGWGLGIREWGLGSGVTNDFDFCEERKKDGLEHATNGGVRIAQRLELRVRE